MPRKPSRLVRFLDASHERLYPTTASDAADLTDVWEYADQRAYAAHLSEMVANGWTVQSVIERQSRQLLWSKPVLLVTYVRRPG